MLFLVYLLCCCSCVLFPSTLWDCKELPSGAGMHWDFTFHHDAVVEYWCVSMCFLILDLTSLMLVSPIYSSNPSTNSLRTSSLFCLMDILLERNLVLNKSTASLRKWIEPSGKYRCQALIQKSWLL